MKTTILIIIAVAALVMNPVAFVLMGVDKKRARKGAWRIPEKTLFLPPGAMHPGVAQKHPVFLRGHKIRVRVTELRSQGVFAPGGGKTQLFQFRRRGNVGCGKGDDLHCRPSKNVRMAVSNASRQTR